MRFKLVEQSPSQARANTKTKNSLKQISAAKGLNIQLPQGTVVHHYSDQKNSSGLKDNSWSNVVVIPSIEGNSSYAEMVHRIITVFSRMPKGTTVQEFLNTVMNTEAFTYDEQTDTINSIPVRDLMIGG